MPIFPLGQKSPFVLELFVELKVKSFIPRSSNIYIFENKLNFRQFYGKKRGLIVITAKHNNSISLQRQQNNDF